MCFDNINRDLDSVILFFILITSFYWNICIKLLQKKQMWYFLTYVPKSYYICIIFFFIEFSPELTSQREGTLFIITVQSCLLCIYKTHRTIVWKVGSEAQTIGSKVFCFIIYTVWIKVSLIHSTLLENCFQNWFLTLGSAPTRKRIKVKVRVFYFGHIPWSKISF